MCEQVCAKALYKHCVQKIINFLCTISKEIHMFKPSILAIDLHNLFIHFLSVNNLLYTLSTEPITITTYYLKTKRSIVIS
jgi:hypothetical protein